MTAGDLITADFQLEFGALLAGAGTAVAIQTLEGFDALPITAGENYPLAAEHGSIAGIRLARERVLAVTFEIDADPDAIRTAVNLIRGAVIAGLTDEIPLVVRLPDRGPVQAYARVTDFAIPSTRALAGWGVVVGTIEWTASDPVLYSTTLRQVPVPVFAGSGGLTYDVNYDKDYGSAGVGLTTALLNDGDWPTWPRFVITGPSSGTVQPLKIENVTDGTEIVFTSGGGLTIPAGSTLVVDTHPARRVVRFTDGGNRWNTVAGTTWAPIYPGGAELRFRATGTTDGVTVTAEVRDAYL